MQIPRLVKVGPAERRDQKSVYGICHQVGKTQVPPPLEKDSTFKLSIKVGSPPPTFCNKLFVIQGGITCGAIDEPRKSSKAIDERIIINFRDKNGVIARFSDKNGGFLFHR